MAYSIVRLLKVLSMIVCLIVVASFTIFVVQQSRGASEQQQNEVASVHHEKVVRKPSALHKAIDEASEQLTSPFAGIVSPSQSEWGSRIVELILALLVYGLGMGFVVRFISIKA